VKSDAHLDGPGDDSLDFVHDHMNRRSRKHVVVVVDGIPQATLGIENRGRLYRTSFCLFLVSRPEHFHPCYR
jgi:hypothetical protein